MALVLTGKDGEAMDPTSEEFMEKGQSGQVVGVIIPPPDIRAVVDKTAQFVARHGKDFEQKIIQKAAAGGGSASKFNFMRQGDPYNAYYEFKIKEFEEGGPVEKPWPAAAPAPDEEKKVEAEAEDKATDGGASGGIVRKQKMNALAAVLTSKEALTKPPPHVFSMVHPVGVSNVDVDVIKLTAQYTAVSGRHFLAGLAQREQRNPQFDFLKPTHLLFSYFTGLVDAYTKVMQPPPDQKAAVEAASKSRDAILARTVARWQWERQEAAAREREKVDTDKQAQLYLAVNWHEFVVVETIDFPEGEHAPPPAVPAPKAPPPSLASSGAAAGAAQTPVSAAAPRAAAAATSGGGDDDMDMDMEDDTGGGDEDDDAEPLNVVQNYQPQVSTGAAAGPATVIDPLSGRAVLASDVSEHMRISLLDPKWREEQARLKEKTAQETMAAGSGIASALKSFAKQRGDIFGSTEEEEEEALRARSQATGGPAKDEGRLVWDGTSASAASVQTAALTRAAEQQQDAARRAAEEQQKQAQRLFLQQQQQQAQQAQRLPVPPPQAPAPASAPRPPPPAPPPTALSAPPVAPPRAPLAMPPPGLPTPVLPIPAALPTPVMPPPGIPPGMSAPRMPPPNSMPAPGAPPAHAMPPATRPNPSGAAAGNDSEGPAAKKARVDPSTGLMAAEAWAAQVAEGPPLELQLVLKADPSAPPEWGLGSGCGTETITVEDCLTTTIKQLKDTITSRVGLPANKSQLKSTALGFLKDHLTVAHYNLKPGEVLEVSRKKR